MNRYVFTAVAVAAFGVGLAAQKTTEVHPGKGGSPHVRTEWTVDGAAISIEYGRPFLKGRTIGKDVAPIGQIWRAGADEATTIKTDKALKFGSLAVPAGAYTLWVVPGEKDWQLVISKATGQWGTQVQGRRGSWPGADDRRNGEGAGRAAHLCDRRHAEGRDASHRVGHDERVRAVHRGVSRQVTNRSSRTCEEQSAVRTVRTRGDPRGAHGACRRRSAPVPPRGDDPHQVEAPRDFLAHPGRTARRARVEAGGADEERNEDQEELTEPPSAHGLPQGKLDSRFFVGESG